MFHPFLSRKLNQALTNTTAEKLPQEFVDYATTVINGLHVALKKHTKPPFNRREHHVDGWGLTSTRIEERGAIAGIPATQLLGHRAIYLSTTPGLILRVLSAPHPRRFLEERVVQVRSTSIAHLLHEDPTLYYGLLNAAEDTVREFQLEYQPPEAPGLGAP